MIEIDDTNFPCIASSIGGVLVPESLDIIECCQDADNLDIIYIKCSIVGVYEYAPSCVISWDGGIADVTPFFIPNYKSIGVTEFPISAICASRTVLLAYNVGGVIPEFATIPNLTITVTFTGSLGDQDFSQLIQDSQIFVSSNPSATIDLNKGLTPTPYRLYFDRISGQLKIQYSSLGDVSCLCAINCATPNTEDFNLTICQDEVQEISIDNTSIFGNPIDAEITFRDAMGNLTPVSIHAMIGVQPASPGVQLYADPQHIQVNIWYISYLGVVIRPEKVFYQILKYENNVDNAFVWKDWTNKNWKTIFDRDIQSGRKYGYAVRFKGEFNEVSELSAWTTLDVP